MDVLESGLFYLICFIACLVFTRYSETTGKKGGIVIAAALLIFVSGFRAYTVGVDTSSYKVGVEYFLVNNEAPWNVSFADGYGYFAKVVLTVWNNYSFLLFVQAFITNGLILARLWDYRETASLTFMVFVYLCTLYLHTLNLSCQSLAMAIVFYFTRYLDRNKPVLYFIGIAVATSLHLSALIGVVIVILKYMQFRNITARRALVQTLVLVICCVFAVYAFNLMLERYSNYIESSSAGFMFFARTLILVASLLLSGYFAYSEGDECGASLRLVMRDRAPMVVSLYALSVLLSAMSYVIAPNAGRISYYFALYGPVVYGAIAKQGRQSKECFLCALVLTAWFVVYCWYVFMLKDGGGILPYAFVWGG